MIKMWASLKFYFMQTEYVSCFIKVFSTKVFQRKCLSKLYNMSRYWVQFMEDKDLKKKFSLLHIVCCSCVIKSEEVRLCFINVPLEIWCDVNLIHGNLIWKVSYSKKKKNSSENKQYTTKLFSFLLSFHIFTGYFK